MLDPLTSAVSLGIQVPRALGDKPPTNFYYLDNLKGTTRALVIKWTKILTLAFKIFEATLAESNLDHARDSRIKKIQIDHVWSPRYLCTLSACSRSRPPHASPGAWPTWPIVLIKE